MTNEYMAPQVIEIGEVDELILGAKPLPNVEEAGEATHPYSDLDD